ncbi:MAG: hypothetical protein ACRDMA_03020 [Solirubrobacterales bacterium]
MAKTPICALMRVRRETVGRIVERVVGDHLDSERLRGLVIIGVDEVSYRTGEEGDDVLEVASVAGAGSGERRAGSNPSSVARAAKTGRRSAAIRRARRSQPRAVVSGTPALDDAGRWPRPCAATTRAPKTASARSSRRP